MAGQQIGDSYERIVCGILQLIAEQQKADGAGEVVRSVGNSGLGDEPVSIEFEERAGWIRESAIRCATTGGDEDVSVRQQSTRGILRGVLETLWADGQRRPERPSTRMRIVDRRISRAAE